VSLWASSSIESDSHHNPMREYALKDDRADACRPDARMLRLVMSIMSLLVGRGRYVAHMLPQLHALDGKEITRSLRIKAEQAFPVLQVGRTTAVNTRIF
jgi:hypothetical protein